MNRGRDKGGKRIAAYDPCRECPKGKCDNCQMCLYFVALESSRKVAR
jgi:hypothetical protein